MVGNKTKTIPVVKIALEERVQIDNCSPWAVTFLDVYVKFRDFLNLYGTPVNQ